MCNFNLAIVSQYSLQKYWPEQALRSTQIVLRTFSEQIPVLGRLDGNVKYKDQTVKLPLYMVE